MAETNRPGRTFHYSESEMDEDFTESLIECMEPQDSIILYDCDFEDGGAAFVRQLTQKVRKPPPCLLGSNKEPWIRYLLLDGNPFDNAESWEAFLRLLVSCKVLDILSLGTDVWQPWWKSTCHITAPLLLHAQIESLHVKDANLWIHCCDEWAQALKNGTSTITTMSLTLLPSCLEGCSSTIVSHEQRQQLYTRLFSCLTSRHCRLENLRLQVPQQPEDSCLVAPTVSWDDWVHIAQLLAQSRCSLRHVYIDNKHQPYHGPSSCSARQWFLQQWTALWWWLVRANPRLERVHADVLDRALYRDRIEPALRENRVTRAWHKVQQDPRREALLPYAWSRLSRHPNWLFVAVQQSCDVIRFVDTSSSTTKKEPDSTDFTEALTNHDDEVSVREVSVPQGVKARSQWMRLRKPARRLRKFVGCMLHVQCTFGGLLPAVPIPRVSL